MYVQEAGMKCTYSGRFDSFSFTRRRSRSTITTTFSCSCCMALSRSLSLHLCAPFVKSEWMNSYMSCYVLSYLYLAD